MVQHRAQSFSFDKAVSNLFIGNEYIIMYSYVTKGSDENIRSRCKDLCITKVGRS
jgi:hypothetical protein